MRTIAWGAVVYGAAVGLAGALLVFLVLGIAGLDNDLRGQTVLIFLTYTAYMVAGHVAGRFAPHAEVLHGGVSAMVLFGLQVVVSRAGLAALLFGGVTAAILGSAGGALAQWARERSIRGSQDEG